MGPQKLRLPDGNWAVGEGTRVTSHNHYWTGRLIRGAYRSC